MSQQEPGWFRSIWELLAFLALWIAMLAIRVCLIWWLV
jgi:hypothetical protein